MNILSDYYKVCPTCEEEYIAKRLNQIYCTPRCKALKNNHKAKWIKEDYNAITFDTNQMLWSIRNFLKKKVGQELAYRTISKNEFRLGVITGFYLDETTKANVLKVYDYAYYFINEEAIKIIKL